MSPTVQFEVLMPVRFTKKADYYIGCCPPVDVMTQGDTKKEVEANLREAIGLFLESCYTRGVLEQVMEEAGFSHQAEKATRRTPATDSVEKRFRIPLPFFNPSESVSTYCPA